MRDRNGNEITVGAIVHPADGPYEVGTVAQLDPTAGEATVAWPSSTHRVADRDLVVELDLYTEQWRAAQS